MIVLSFDTSGPSAAVVVAKDGEVVGRTVLRERHAHAAGLLPAIEAALSTAGSRPADISVVVVGEGPGSFTGVRVGAATAKGLGLALRVPVHALSSLAAAALAVDGAPVRYALFDARAERVYAACYGVGHHELSVLAPVVHAELRDLLADDVPPGAVFVGDGAEKHRAAIEGAGFTVIEAGPEQTLADGLIRGLLRADTRVIDDLGSWEPEYVRTSSAERLWTP